MKCKLNLARERIRIYISWGEDEGWNSQISIYFKISHGFPIVKHRAK